MGWDLLQERGQGWEQGKSRAVSLKKCQGCEGTFGTRPSGKDVLVSKSCSSGWQHLQTITGARGIASDLVIPLLLLASVATCMVLLLTWDPFMLFLSPCNATFESICFVCQTLNAEMVNDDFPCYQLCWIYPMPYASWLKSELKWKIIVECCCSQLSFSAS